MPWIPLAIGAGLGAVQAQNKKDDETKDRILQAQTTKYSPWTGMQGKAPDRTNTIGMIAGGATAGAQFGQNMQASQDMHNWMNQGYSPYADTSPGARLTPLQPIYGAGMTPSQVTNNFGTPGTYWGSNPYSR